MNSVLDEMAAFDLRLLSDICSVYMARSVAAGSRRRKYSRSRSIIRAVPTLYLYVAVDQPSRTNRWTAHETRSSMIAAD